MKFILKLCLVFCFLGEEYVFSQDINLLKKQLQNAKADTAQVRLCMSLGEAYHSKELDSCLIFYNQSQQIAQKIGDYPTVAKAILSMGNFYVYTLKDETKALYWLNKGVAIAKKNKDFSSLTQYYSLLSIVALHQHTANSEDFCLQASMYVQYVKDWRAKLDFYETTYDFYMINGQNNKAIPYLEKALALSRKHDLDIWFTEGLDYAELLEKQDRKQAAQQVYQELNNQKERLKISKGEFVYLNDLAKLEMKLKNYEIAKNHLMKALDIELQKNKKDTLHLYFIQRNLEALYVAQEDYKNAYHASKDFMKSQLWLNQKRQVEDARLQMTKQKASLDLEKKEVEIALLETKRKEQWYFLVGAIIIAIGLSIFLWTLQRSKQKIDKQRTALRQLNTTKDKLFAILSHDLRSPVASLKSYLSLLDWGALSQQEFADSTQHLSTQLVHVNSMLDNVLNWSISEMGGMNANRQLVDMQLVIQDVFTQLTNLAESKEIQLINLITPNTLVKADKEHLMIIFRNLIQNALKFTEKGGNITLNSPSGSNIWVKDTGIGMSEETIRQLFQLQKRTSKVGTQQETGTGLGLILVKDLVESNKGTIEVSSQLGSGTTFKLRFES